MRNLSGFLLAVLAGGLWGSVIMIVAGVTLTLASGAVAVPQVGAGFISGVVSALFQVWWQEKQTTRKTTVFAGLICFLVLMAVTFAAPFGLPLDAAMPWHPFAIVGLVVCVALANRLCLAGVSFGPMSRYDREVVYIRIMKGIGFVIFSIIVILPFYVMVMTSLKSQQALLANPLDLSIDVSQGFSSLFRSYVELFTEYNFGRYLLVSAFVSVATVILTLLFSVPGAYAVSRLRCIRSARTSPTRDRGINAICLRVRFH